MTKAKTLTALGLVLLAAVFVFLQYMNDFSRLKRVEIGSTSVDLSTLNKIVLKNNSSSKIEFPLRCYYKMRSGGKPLFSEVVVLLPNASLEFDVNPELVGREMPSMIANKSCEAIWRGPFGIERSAWWVSWEHGQRASKTISIER